MTSTDFNASSSSKPQKVKVAAIQMNSQGDPAANRAQATALIRQAAAQGATFIVTPEYTNIIHHEEKDSLDSISADDDTNPDLRHYKTLAQELGVWLDLGSMAVKLAPDKMANRQFMINPAGDIVARYDKIHMFDVDLPNGQSFRESDTVRPGETATIAQTPFGKVGMNICYDLRFPEQQKAEALEGGASILTVPSAYTVPSGQRTWETFLRARAAETGCYVIAPGQCGTYEDGKGASWGHSMIVSPWGTVVPQAADPDKPGIVIADIDPAEVAAARESYPVDAQTMKFKFNVQAADAQRPDGQAAPAPNKTSRFNFIPK